MRQQRLVTGLAAAFALMTATFLVGGIVYSPALLLLAVIFGGVTYLLYYQASGRLLARLYQGVERQASTSSSGRGGFGAGPREEWTPPRQEQRQRARRQRARRGQGGRRQRVAGQSGPSVGEASKVLGVRPGADEGAVRRAYRERIKEVHPDADDGDEEKFKRVQEAYEVLTE